MTLTPFVTLLRTAQGIDDGAVLAPSDDARLAALEIDPLLVASHQGTATEALDLSPMSGPALAVAALRGLAQHLGITASGEAP